MRVRKLHARATLVVCAFRLSDLNDPYAQDYADDGVHGRGGRCLLKLLTDSNIINKAVFVVKKIWWNQVRRPKIHDRGANCSRYHVSNGYCRCGLDYQKEKEDN